MAIFDGVMDMMYFTLNCSYLNAQDISTGYIGLVSIGIPSARAIRKTRQLLRSAVFTISKKIMEEKGLEEHMPPPVSFKAFSSLSSPKRFVIGTASSSSLFEGSRFSYFLRNRKGFWELLVAALIAGTGGL